MLSNPANDVAFLGFCERAEAVRDGNTNLLKWNILGLKHVILTPVFPVPLSWWSIALAVSKPLLNEPTAIQFLAEDGQELGTLTLSTRDAGDDASLVSHEGEPLVQYPVGGWATLFMPLTDFPLLIPKAGVYLVALKEGETRKLIGRFQCVLLEVPKLSAERVAAIRSDPTAGKFVRMELACRFCSSRLRVWAGLDREQGQRTEDWTWYEDLPEFFLCSCGKTSMDLSSIRTNLHALLGQHTGRAGAFQLTSLYDAGSLDSLRSEFVQLLNASPREEDLQQLIARNPLILHQFPAELILAKPRILTSFVADFGVLTPAKELVLIELEKASTPLLKQDGGKAAELTHALDQAASWLQVVDDHRLAFLDGINLSKDQVGHITAVVIAGRDANYNQDHLRRLKAGNANRIKILTYDDLLHSLDALCRRFSKL
jgi:hypothetical protein